MFCVLPWVPFYPACVMFYLGILPSFMSRMSWEFHQFLRILDLSDTYHHHHSFLGPLLFLTVIPTNGLVILKTSSNLIALKLMVDISFLDCWLLNRILTLVVQPNPYYGEPFNQYLIVYVFLEHTSLYHLIWQMLCPCSHNCGNPSFWKSQWMVAESISHLLILSLVYWWTLVSELASLVHFLRILHCHLVNLCCTFSSQASWVWGTLTPIRSESRSDMMVGTYFQEL